LIFLMGGEPLLYRKFDEVVSYVKSQGLECHVTTNAILIPEHIETLKKVDLLMVSLDGNKNGNDLNRGRGAFEKTTHGLEVAKANGIPLRINCVLTKNNIGDVEWLLDYADKLGAYVGFTIPAKCAALNQMSNMIMSHDEVISVHKQLLALKKQGRKITLSERSLNHVINYPRRFDELIYKSDLSHEEVYTNECPYGRFVVFINAEGYIYPCTTLWEYPSVFEPKNLFIHGFDEALRNAQELPCWICYCAGGPEWDNMSSIAGIFDALKFALS